MKAMGCSEGAKGVVQTIAGPSLGRHKNLRILECAFRISEGTYEHAGNARARVCPEDEELGEGEARPSCHAAGPPREAIRSEGYCGRGGSVSLGLFSRQRRMPASSASVSTPSRRKWTCRASTDRKRRPQSAAPLRCVPTMNH